MKKLLAFLISIPLAGFANLARAAYAITVLVAILLFMPLAAFAAPKPALSGAMGQGSTGPTVVLSWTASASCAAPVSCTANVYRAQAQACPANGATAGVTWTKIASAVVEAGSYTDANPGNVGASCYYVTDVATGNGWVNTESGASNTWQATFPVTPPGKLAGSTH